MLSLLSVLSACLLLAGIVYFGWRKPEYSHVRHTISELGEVGSADAHLVGYGLFLVVGLLLVGLGALSGSQLCVGWLFV